MPNSPTTLASSACETSGTPVPLSYGYVWVTGKRQNYYMLQNTGNDWMDYSRVGMWLLGHGEWDGFNEIWINDLLALRGLNPTGPLPGASGQNWYLALDSKWSLVFNFHSGCDADIDLDMSTFASSGPDQGMDVLWPLFPPAIQPLAYSRIAYYSIWRKQPAQYQTTAKRNDPTQWADVAPVGLWRALKCRLFDADGNQTGYAFTTNPAWHFVDVLLRRKVFPDFALPYGSGPDPLPQAVQARFDWESIFEAAQYFQEILANGRPRFSGSYSFSSQTTLQAVLTQILLCCRSFAQEVNGQIQLVPDKPRDPVFIFSREHLLPGTFDFTDQALSSYGNRVVSTMRDILVPAAANITITQITCPDHTNPTVTMSGPHPFNPNDWIAIGGTDTIYDGEWQVASVPPVENIGTPAEIDPTTFSLVSKGSNYPTSVGAGGLVGLLQSRFKERVPEFWHKANMLARGALGIGIPRQRQKVKQQLDFANLTYDQVARISTYERDRSLGFDTTGTDGQLDSPYITPPVGKLSTSFFAKDVNGALAAAVRPGDVVEIDESLSFTYQGLYEVTDGLAITVPTSSARGNNGSIAMAADPQSGEIEFPLRWYDPDYFYDESDQNASGWLNVPGSDPGNDTNYTVWPLSDGIAAFTTGALPSGTQFQLPSIGFSPSNVLDWEGPQGYLEAGNPMHVIEMCDADSNRVLTLEYEDGEGDTWSGDVNYAALTWLSPDTTTSSGPMTWLAQTLLGGEEVLWGEGVLADGSTIALPSGWSASQCLAAAFPHDGTPTGNDAHGVASFVDPGTLEVHLNYQDGEGNIWHGNAKVIVFAWKNNMSTAITETDSGANWVHFLLTDGTVFGVGLAKALANGAHFSLPSVAGDGSSLQAIAVPSAFTIVDHPAHGVGGCFLDENNDVVCFFEDGEGNQWDGSADVWGVFATQNATTPVQVKVTPVSASIAAGDTQPFSAAVLGETSQAVTWSVDGTAGGNSAVGFIDVFGNYTAPPSAGTHTITATSVADPSASGTARVIVYGSNTETLDVLTDEFGNIISINGDVIYVEEN